MTTIQMQWPTLVYASHFYPDKTQTSVPVLSRHSQLSQTEPLMLQADALPGGEVRLVRQREILQFQVDNLAKIWTTIVQAVVGVVLAVGAVAIWRNLRVTQQTLSTTQEKLEVDREAQITNRFTQSIGQLGAELHDGKPNLEVRLGGIYALERIARDSPADRWTITEVLTTYVRQNAPRISQPFPTDPDQPSQRELWHESLNPTKPRVDIQGILTVLGRRIVAVDRPEPGQLDLHGTDLRGADLKGARLERALLSRSDLGGVILRRASLEAADLAGANLEQADLRSAYLELTILRRAHLEGANLSGAHLPGTTSPARILNTQCFGELVCRMRTSRALTWKEQT
jgi:hypothetical protein